MKKSLLVILCVLATSSFAFANQTIECLLPNGDFLKATLAARAPYIEAFVEVIAPDLYSTKDGKSSGVMNAYGIKSGSYFQYNVVDAYGEFKYSVNIPESLMYIPQSNVPTTLNWTLNNGRSEWRTLQVVCSSARN